MSLTADDTPTEIGRFHILWELARGGMGVVYRAFDPLLQRVVAIKIIQHRFAADTGTKLRFLEESQITARLQHPGVPPVYDGGELEDGRPYLAMKLIKGQTLAQQLKEREKLNDQRGRYLQVFESIAQTVGFAHANGVIHRDLKPANIMVGAYGEVQVMDWGLARSAEREAQKNPVDGEPSGGAIFETMDGAMLGTPAYAAPEQARGELDRVDERADVFGLGGLLCMILAGVPPFLGTDVKSTLALAIVGDTSDAVEALQRCGADPELIELCLKCLATEPEQRPVNGQAVAEAVATFRTDAEARTQAARVQQVRAETEALAQRKRQRLLWSALSVLSVLVVLAVWQGYRATVAGDDARNAQKQTDNALKQVTTEKQAAAEALDVATEARRKMFLSVRRLHAEYANEMHERPRWNYRDGKKFYTARHGYDLNTLLPLWSSFQEPAVDSGRRPDVAIEAELRLASLELDLYRGDQALKRYLGIERELKELNQAEPGLDHQLLLAYWHRGLGDIYDQKFDFAQSVEHYAKATKLAEALAGRDPTNTLADRLALLSLYEYATILDYGVSHGHPPLDGVASPTNQVLAGDTYQRLIRHLVRAMPQVQLRDGTSEVKGNLGSRQETLALALDGLVRAWKTIPASSEAVAVLKELHEAARTWPRGGHTSFEVLLRSNFEWTKRTVTLSHTDRLRAYKGMLEEITRIDQRTQVSFTSLEQAELATLIHFALMEELGRGSNEEALSAYEKAFAGSLDNLGRAVVPNPASWLKNCSNALRIYLHATLARFDGNTPAKVPANLVRAKDWLKRFAELKPGEPWQAEWGLIHRIECNLAQRAKDDAALRKTLDVWQARGLPTDVLVDHVRWHGWLIGRLKNNTPTVAETVAKLRKDSVARTTFMIGLIARHDPLSLPKLFEDAEIAPLRSEPEFQRELEKHRNTLLESTPEAALPGQQSGQR